MFLTFSSKLDHTTHNGGNTMGNFTKKAIWENNQRLLGRQQILKEKLSEVKKLRSEIAELEAIKQSLQEVQ